MIFTLYYITATILQSWRLKTIYSKISQQLSSKESVVFYKHDTGLTTTFLSSDLCSNHKQATIQKCLYIDEKQRGYVLVPRQNIVLGSWIEYSPAVNLLSSNFRMNNVLFEESNEIHFLVETGLIPMFHATGDNLMIENFGIPVAWKVDSRFAILLKSDKERFSELIISSFFQDCLMLNHKLPIIRIESVTIEGEPRSFNKIIGCSKKEYFRINRVYQKLYKLQWDRHIQELQQLSLFAKKQHDKSIEVSSIIKPDLIPSKNSSNFCHDKKITTSEKDIPLKIDTIQHNLILENKSDDAHSLVRENVSQNIDICNTMKTVSDTSLKRTKKGGNIKYTKPPNILVYSDSQTTKDNVITTLRNILAADVYTIYPLTTEDVKSQVWIDNATLVVVCGSVPKQVQNIILDYFLKGGKMFCLCSDVLHIILPVYRIAEVREHELVQFTYGKWKQVKMMHHIFCYQPSPIKKQFSANEEEYQINSNSLLTTRNVEVCDSQAENHKLKVQILGTEETWNTPSLMMAKNIKTGGICVFSQIHLEINPLNYEGNEPYYKSLMENENNRIEIFSDLLHKYLELAVSNKTSYKEPKSSYTHGYFLGKYEKKMFLLDQMKIIQNDNILQNEKLKIKFCKTNTIDMATETYLPVLTHICPDNFDTVKYFESLKTEKIGRLVIYSHSMASTMNVIQNVSFAHGITVVSRQQTKGSGRGKNTWLSPEGCLMFSLQLHISLDSHLGQHISLVQHLVSSAVVRGILSLPGYSIW
ncbi:biotin--protein ligase isoform X2 [Culicoides brevitarsis]|uniref:biotin--protein ligase isoform X2 n=1 Tax=Culicoides brevitarsis TaxID=469753 RepID=UPI00307BDF6E